MCSPQQTKCSICPHSMLVAGCRLFLSARAAYCGKSDENVRSSVEAMVLWVRLVTLLRSICSSFEHGYFSSAKSEQTTCKTRFLVSFPNAPCTKRFSTAFCLLLPCGFSSTWPFVPVDSHEQVYSLLTTTLCPRDVNVSFCLRSSTVRSRS